MNIERPTSNVEGEKLAKQTWDLEERLLEYSVQIIRIVEQSPNTKGGNHIAGQLLKSGTSHYSMFKVGCSMLDVHLESNSIWH